MIEIKKGREPDKLLRYRQQQGASYEQMDKDVKDELLNKLLCEQGHLCAYCMKRIPETRKLPQGVPPVTIEHWLPRNPMNKEKENRALDYRNMFAVCAGNRGCGSKDRMTCDAYRGNVRLKVNPCVAETLRGISYSPSGKIKSSDPIVNEDLNKRLNLNNEATSLPENRRQVLQALIADVKKKHASGDISIYCRRKLEQIKEMDDPKLPYVGVLIAWLERHI